VIVQGKDGPREKLLSAKSPYIGNGYKNATTDEQQIRNWWKRWPNAMIGLPMGENGMFALDFDPRTDDDTGEVFTLVDLKAATEAQIGCALPTTLASLTQSGGVHALYAQPAGEPIRNRGNLPQHVDVRGQGGYIVAPPSVLYAEDGRERRYRWLEGRQDSKPVDAPAELIEILRAPKESKTNAGGDQPPSSSLSPRLGAGPAVADVVRKYALAALDRELSDLAATPMGNRNNAINACAFSLGQLVGAGALNEALVRGMLQQTVAGFGRDYDKCCDAIESGLTAGMDQPRDLRAIEENAQRRAERAPSRSASSRPSPSPAPGRAAGVANPPNPSPAPDPGGNFPSSHGGRDAIEALAAGEAAQLRASAVAWVARRLGYAEPKKDAYTKIAFGIGRRIGAGLLDAAAVKQVLRDSYEDVADVQHADIDRAIDDGIARGFDLGPMLVTLRCIRYPMTDFGIAERFRDRFGENYRFTTGKGWLGWDGRRWKVLDQDEKTPPAEVIGGVFDTVRMIQDEARQMADSGVNWTLSEPDKKGQRQLDLDPDNGNPFGLDRWLPKGKGWELLSDKVRAFGRASETSGRPIAIANLARRWLTVPIERFDTDPLALGVLNGTLRFTRGLTPEGVKTATVTMSPHVREDYNTKLAPVVYDPDAPEPCPLYDDMLEWAQPDAGMRRYLHQVGGYGSTGLTGEHKLWYNYGRGRNGKSTTIDAWCYALGDYSGTTLIETFLDQGIKKRGDQASPDLARLGGVRLLRASEPERGAKLNSALIKFVTGGEPVPTRALHRGFFDLVPLFKLIMSGNSKPEIPDTDEGIWSRMKLVSWLKNIDLEFNEDGTPKKDVELLNKIKAQEAAGVFHRLVEGLLDYLVHGLVEPAAVTADTMEYRDASDPLARFLRLCTVIEAGSTVQSSKLYDVFAAWTKAADEREWKQKGFSNAMAEKGFKRHKSSGMHWLDLRLVRAVGDFVDEHGNAKDISTDQGQSLATSTHPPPDRPFAPYDDDDVV